MKYILSGASATSQKGWQFYGRVFNATLGKSWISRQWDRIDRTGQSARSGLSERDILLAFALGMIGIAVSIWGFTQTARVPEIHLFNGLVLHADVPRIAENMVSTSGVHTRTSVHPIASILLYPFGAGLTWLGVDPLTAAKALIVSVMGVNVLLFSLVLRLIGLPRFVTAVITLLFISSASFLYWSAVVESFPFSCLSVLASLFMMFRVSRGHWGWWVAINVLTLGFLITNWMFGLIATAVRFKLKSFLAITLSSLAIVTALSIVQNEHFEKAAYFFNPEPLLRETQFLQTNMEEAGIYEEGWRPSANLRSVYVTTVVAMPTYAQQIEPLSFTSTNQNSDFPAGEAIPLLAMVAWLIVFTAGIIGATRRKDLRVPILGVVAMLSLQTGLHLIYGEVTFLYSLTYLPLLILVAGLAWYAPGRRVILGIAACAALFAAVNNERRLQQTIDVAGCLADIDVVRQFQSYDDIKANPSRDLAALFPDLARENANVEDRCNQPSAA